MPFRRNLREVIDDISHGRGLTETIGTGDYAPLIFYTRNAPTQGVSRATRHNEYEPSTFRIFRESDDFEYESGAAFSEDRPGRFINNTIPQGTPIRIEYLLKSDVMAPPIQLRRDGVDIKDRSIWNIIGGEISDNAEEGWTDITIGGGTGGGNGGGGTGGLPREYIPVGMNYVVAVGEQLLLYGGITVDGDLTLEGSLVILD